MDRLWFMSPASAEPHTRRWAMSRPAATWNATDRAKDRTSVFAMPQPRLRRTRLARAGAVAISGATSLQLANPHAEPHGRSIYFPDAGSLEDLPRWQEAVREHLAQLLSRRQDRGGGRQRLRQVDPDEDHGRHRQGVQRRG